MMTVMLIDDDVPMLDYVRFLLEQSGLELKLATPASGSGQALELFHEHLPDLAIVDIGLPGMDGLELAEAFRLMKPEVRLIFLTCYEDFHYSKRAIQLEADDYLIKDELTPEQLKISVHKAMDRFRERRELLKHYSFRQAIERNREVLKQNFLNQLLSGSGEWDHIRLLGERLGISWKKPFLVHGFLHIDAASVLSRYRYGDIPLLHFAVGNIAAELSADREPITALMDRETGIYLLWNTDDPDAPKDTLIRYMETVCEKAEQYLKVSLRGFYAAEAFPVSEFAHAYRQLAEQRDCSFYDPPGPAVMLKRSEAYRMTPESKPEKEKSMLALALEEENAAWIDLAVGKLQQHAEDERWSPRLLKEAWADCVRRMASETNGAAEEAFFHHVSRSLHAEEAAQLTKRELLKLWRRQALTPISEREKDARLQAIDDYLRQHADRTITSVDMAEHLYLNPSYFSRYFKRLSGMKFTDYVNRIKVDMAISMLRRENETVENVAYTLGFSDRAYFSKVFKKYSGKSPSEFKNV
ncbi:helix-turn-helix domain-containing protein [Paenibacillus sp. HN-1]|uniref:response regulator n=1 Tax=Paenibacillus TaxID=44249 RepID=UPI001CA827FA|nr:MULTISPECIES: helix-turn-helix domain-containing protein [Paenibacillus]MBY9080777.1 helix-turn-helix domain-containing protein [Paenibacillus sp. CGMCC 1.18879]MBY9085231.1 helix-turn-helix domain-containing protein [Paenibacillus sinensis]